MEGKLLKDWFFFGILALIFWGFWGLFPKLATNYINPKSVLIFQTMGYFLVLPFVLLSLHFRPEIHPKGIIFAICGGLAAAMGAIFFFYSIAKGKASVVVTMTALYPLVTIILSFLLLKETITLKQTIGLILAIIAMLLFVP